MKDNKNSSFTIHNKIIEVTEYDCCANFKEKEVNTNE